MIPKTFLLAFLSLQSSNNLQTSDKGNTASEAAVRINVLHEPVTAFHGAEFGIEKSFNEIDYLSTPRVQTGGSDVDDDAQVPMKIPSGQEVVIQRGSREINFNNVPPGFYDPTEVSFPDGFQVLGQPHTWNLKDAFPNIRPPPGISRVWGPFPDGSHFNILFNKARGTATNVSIEFGWIENGALTAGGYNSQIWTARQQGWTLLNGPSGSFNGSDWATSHNLVASGDRFEFDFFVGAPDKVLAISRVFYDLP